MSRIKIELDENELRKLIMNHISNVLGSVPFKEDSVIIEVKSKQNYRSEWEKAAFRAIYEVSI